MKGKRRHCLSSINTFGCVVQEEPEVNDIVEVVVALLKLDLFEEHRPMHIAVERFLLCCFESADWTQFARQPQGLAIFTLVTKSLSILAGSERRQTFLGYLQLTVCMCCRMRGRGYTESMDLLYLPRQLCALCRCLSMSMNNEFKLKSMDTLLRMHAFVWHGRVKPNAH